MITSIVDYRCEEGASERSDNSYRNICLINHKCCKNRFPYILRFS